LREADDDLAIAKMPLEVQAYTVVPGEKSNEDLRDLKLRKLQLTDPEYRAAKEARAKIEGSIAAVDIAIKHLEERFTATKAVAKLETARLSFLADV
jgi:predicted transcriptional regulator